MREIRLSLGKSDGQFRARVHLSENHTRQRLRAPTASVPGFKDSAHVFGPWHRHRATGLEHHNRVRICGCDSSDQIVLAFGKRQTVEIHSFALPLVGEHDSDVRLSGQGRRGGWVGTGVVLNLRVRSAGPNGSEGRSRKPYVSLPRGVTLPRRHDGVSTRGIDLGGSTTGDHPHVGVRPDYCNTASVGRIEWEWRAFVSEQHNTLLL